MMTYRRTRFSCVPWFVYTVLCILLISAGAGALIRYVTGSTLNYPVLYGLAVIPAAALYWCIRIVSVYARTKWTWRERTARILTGAVFALIVALGVLLRIMCLNGYVSGGALPYGISPDQIMSAADSARYMDMASSMLGQMRQGGVTDMGYGLGSFYTWLLSLSLSFLGDKPEAAVFLQIVLQMISLVTAFFATRILAGRLPACVVCLYLACSGYALGSLFAFTPEWLFFTLYMPGLLLAAGFVRAYCANRLAAPAALLWAAAAGAAAGFLAYLDMFALSLLIVVLLPVFGKKKQGNGIKVRNGAWMTAAAVAVSVLSCIAVWAFSIGTVFFAEGRDYAVALFDRITVYLRNVPEGFEALPYPDLLTVCAAVCLASFLVFEYFRSGKMQNYMPWIVMCLVAAPTPVWVYSGHGFVIPALYLWTVLAGLGLQNCLFGDKAKVMQAVIEEINSTVEAKTNYIENPLPLPKKHVKKDMDYQYDVAQKDMKYDVEVPENDDYDLQ